jgi:tetratricopeptide (TPR) repeat protein
MKSVYRFVLGAVLLAGLLAPVCVVQAQEWEEPKHWSEIGTVDRWLELDSKFYRIAEDIQYLDKSQYNVNQIKEYEKTRIYNGTLEGIGLRDWKALDDKAREDRGKQATKELKYLSDFRNRVEQQAQRTKESSASGWGGQTQDVTVVGTCLSKLRTATGLEPANPYAWHMLSFFARVVGDLDRCETALVSARYALDDVPEGHLIELRAAVALDLAWLHRDQGKFKKALEEVALAESLSQVSMETVALRGLVAAQSGDVQLAGEIASKLGSVEVSKFPPNLTSLSYGPDIPDISAWRKKSSGYMKAWILALSWLQQGNADMASASFREYSLNDVYPLGPRFWSDAAFIYEMTGRRQMAVKAWSVARIYVPYIPYLIYKPYGTNLGQLTGRPGELPFFLGFDRFFMSGNRLAYAAQLVDAAAAATDEMEKQEMAARALDQLDICISTGYYAGQAQVMSGQVYYLMGDLQTALMEVQGALEKLQASGDEASVAAVLAGLSKASGEIDSKDIANFYGQSGTQTGRWIVDEDPVAKLEELRKANATEPTDATRRDLARYLIRNVDPVEGQKLALGAFTAGDLETKKIIEIPAEDMELILEADRAQGHTELGLALVNALEGGAEDPWNDTGLWAMAGFICLDTGHEAEGKFALQRASELDPGNQGLKVQLALMGG